MRGVHRVVGGGQQRVGLFGVFEVDAGVGEGEFGEVDGAAGVG
ncbi:MAG: hypothetical protein ACRDSN_15310 [Pseudonocardiaceae bacterium]